MSNPSFPAIDFFDIDTFR